jgi:hypothetical protein
MRATNIFSVTSPISPDKIRLQADVIYQNNCQENFWIDYPRELGSDISLSGNPWLSLLTPLAMKLREPLSIEAPVDRIHFENNRKLIDIWKIWYPFLEKPVIDVEVKERLFENKPGKTLSFFSAGIDSCFSLAWHNDPLLSKGQTSIEDVMIIWGFDIPLSNGKEFKRKLDRAKTIEGPYKVSVIDVATNIRETMIKDTNWGFLTHGPALAAIALGLEKRYKKVLIASTGGYGDLKYWGSHVLTDPLFANAQTEFVHDGAEYDRVEKTRSIMNSSLMDILHVCNTSLTDQNCSRCEKCLRTMIILDIMGQLDQYKAFDISQYDPKKIVKILVGYDYIQYTWKKIHALALDKNRKDIADLIDQMFTFSGKRHKQIEFARNLSKKRFGWKIGTLLLKHLQKDIVE